MSEGVDRVNTLMSLFKRRGIIFPAFSLHGGVAGLFDYGPVGGRILRRIQERWRQHWLKLGNIVEIDSPTITPHAVLETSGHVGAFNDHASECGECAAIFRSDHLVEEYHPNPDMLTAAELDGLLTEHNIGCPSCASAQWVASRPMNLMFATRIGATGGGRQAYMRPETAQGMFLTFPNLLRHFRDRLPFGAIQVGKGYRNEISPRQGVIRQREFNMAELEYFIDPESDESIDLLAWSEPFKLVPDPRGEAAQTLSMTIGKAVSDNIVRHPTVAHFMALTHDFLISVGADAERIRFRQHEGDEMAHYASDCWDLEMHGSYGWVECVGIAHRGCYDLAAHEVASGSRELRAWRAFSEPEQVDRMVVSPRSSITGPQFKQLAKEVNKAISELESLPDNFPHQLTLDDGSCVEITEEMVVEKRIQETIRGEWYLPHVVEPAFGLDRIIWHLLDHAHERVRKGGDEYTIMHLAESIAPYDVVVLPLFEKDGMGALAVDIQHRLLEVDSASIYYDGTKSIGRRYARADEIGVPWAVTVDHTSLEDGTVTLRRRDDQKQTRVSQRQLIEHLSRGTLSELF